MISIKRVYESKSSDDGYRVLVDRLWPRGLSKEKAAIDIWMKDIGPSNELRKWFNHEAAKWPEFKKRYQDELKKKKELLESLKKLEKDHGRLTLLYGAHDTEHNQAVVLAEVLK
ncbi:MAG TPA: DUF488 domain-containing protein [Candidatus Saccharimonadales bacterium]|nr:DUF488 domain-containing protein [Candidatus Saccharimonadales bacterium]